MPETAREDFRSLGVVILGAGASLRMRRPKLLLPWGGTTIIGSIFAQWRKLGVGQIVIIHRPDDRPLLAELDRLGFPQSDRVQNPQPEQGMFSSIQCAARWNGWRETIGSRVIVLGDQPHLRSQMLGGLLKFHLEHADAVCQPEFGGREGHPVVLPGKIFAELSRTRAETLKDFLKHIPCSAVQYSVIDPSVSLDLDTPEDYKEAVTRFSAYEKS